jgi:hypothetical protein
MSVDRKLTFLKMIECYSNSFEGEKNGIYSHDRRYLKKLLEAQGDAKDVSSAAMRLDPRLTSTETGAVVYSLARVISEDKELAPNFIDIELADKTLVLYFDHKTKAEVINRVVGESGTIGFLARPTDRLSDTIISDMYVVALDPKSAVQESIVKDMKKRFMPEAAPVTAPSVPAVNELGATNATGAGAGSDDSDTRDSDDNENEEDDEKDGKSKKKSADKKDKAQEKDDLETESVRQECKELGLEEALFVDKLSSCTLTKQVVEAIFKRYMGESSVSKVLVAPIAGNKITVGNELQERDRLLRVLASKGLMSGKIDLSVPESVTKVIESFKDKMTQKGDLSFPVSDMQYSDLVDEVVVALDRAHSSDLKPLFKMCVERTIPIKLSTERSDKLVGYVSEAYAKNESQVLISLVKACAKVIIAEASIAADEAEADERQAWINFVVEATKPAPEPKDEASVYLDDILPA